MSKLKNLQPERVFKYFEEICAIPHGSGNTDRIAQYCMDFAAAHSLKAERDGANNVIIYKQGTVGYEKSAPVILQGHIDMVCQKTEDCAIDFEKDGLDLYVDGDLLKARGTTLGADNGIAVAMVLAILESTDIPHPPIEALFTSDEEIGMVGAIALDGSKLSGKRLINIDSEEQDTLTVSCAGGSDFTINAPLLRKSAEGTPVTIKLSGLKGGHSGVEIDKGRINANILTGRLLNTLKDELDFEIINLFGGDKGNAIPCAATVEILTKDPEKFAFAAKDCLTAVKKETAAREPELDFTISIGDFGAYDIIGIKKELIFLLACAPNGVLKMSAEIEGLVETSLNLGILSTSDDMLYMLFTLRSNKTAALRYLEKKLTALCSFTDCTVKTSGHYPPWEFKADSELQRLYREIYFKTFAKQPRVEAIHAGLECGVLSGKIEGLDCISIGPDLFDVHTVSERLSVSSADAVYKLIIEMLAKMK